MKDKLSDEDEMEGEVLARLSDLIHNMFEVLFIPTSIFQLYIFPTLRQNTLLIPLTFLPLFSTSGIKSALLT